MKNIVDTSRLCMGCMSVLEQAEGYCPKCGYNVQKAAVFPHQLRPYTILSGKYLIGKVLGEGGFGVTYLGYDLNLDIRIAIKEYYPVGLVVRETTAMGTSTVSPFSGDKLNIYESGLDKFVDEAKSLAKFYTLPGIVAVKDFFKENGTAYIVMEFVDGITLKKHLENSGGKLRPDEVFELMRPLMKSLSQVHAEGIIHRDISPDNIMLTNKGEVKLLDFGAARGYSDSNQSRSVLLKPGYAPAEQYRTRGHQGPWTDVYALCATMYKMMTGQTPPESLERTEQDELIRPTHMGIQLSKQTEDALIKGMAVYEKDRFKSVDELYFDIYGATRQESPVQQYTVAPNRQKIVETPPVTAEHIKTTPVHPSFVTQPQVAAVQAKRKSPVGRILAGIFALLIQGVAFSFLFSDLYNPDLHYPAQFLLMANALYIIIDLLSDVFRKTQKPKRKQNTIYAVAQCIVVLIATGVFIAGRGAEGGFSFYYKPILDIGYGFGLIVVTNIAYLVTTILTILSIVKEGRTASSAGQQAKKQYRTSIIATAMVFIFTTSAFFITYSIVVQSAIELDKANFAKEMTEKANTEQSAQSSSDVTADPDVIQWTDSNLESLIREQIGIPTGDILISDVKGITEVCIFGDTIGEYSFGEAIEQNRQNALLAANGIGSLTDVSDLKHFENLKSLSIQYNSGLDLSSLNELTQIENLDIEHNEITDLSPLKSMTWLRRLNLWDSGISDVTPLAVLDHLEYLIIGGSEDAKGELSDITPLGNLINLKNLYIFHNSVSDITPLSPLTNLEDLALSYNSVSDVSPLAGLTNLKNLYILGNPANDFTPLQSLIDAGLNIVSQ